MLDRPRQRHCICCMIGQPQQACISTEPSISFSWLLYSVILLFHLSSLIVASQSSVHFHLHALQSLSAHFGGGWLPIHTCRAGSSIRLPTQLGSSSSSLLFTVRSFFVSPQPLAPTASRRFYLSLPLSPGLRSIIQIPSLV